MGERETDGQIYRWTDRQTEADRERADIQTDTETDKQIQAGRDRQTHTGRQTQRPTGNETESEIPPLKA